MITLPCPSCGKAFDVEDSLAARATVCPPCAARASAAKASAPAERLDAAAAGAAPESARAAPGPAADEQRCPFCAEVIKKGARICRFCKTDLERPPEPSRPRLPSAAAPRKSSSAPIWILLGVFLFIGVVCVGGFVFVLVNQRGVFGQAMEQTCRQQLATLYSALRAYEKDEGGAPRETGSAFWAAIAETQDVEEALDCPSAVMSDMSRDSWPYRGPAVPWDRVPEDGIIACDRVKSHLKGVNVLFKNGRVEFAPKDGELYRRALRETAD